jgi:small GTP-binding protein
MLLLDTNPSMYKIVLLGNTRCGKTSILARQLTDGPIENLNATIGVNCHEVVMSVNGTRVSLNVWDTAGQELYYAVVPIYVRGASAALLVCDIADRSSFTRLEWWHSLISEHAGQAVPLFVVANKVDLAASRVVDDDELLAFADSHSAKLFRSSALTGEGVAELFRAVAETMIQTAEANEARGSARAAFADRKCC